MKKRFAFLSMTILSTALWVNSASAQARFLEEKDFQVLHNPLPLQKDGQAEVVEFFSYACGHCANLEPHIIEWANERKPKDVGFYQIPAVGGDIWTFVAQVKYTADKLGLDETFGQSYFDAIHKEKQRPLLGDKKTALDFIAKAADVSTDEVEKAWNSLQVKGNLAKSARLWQQAELDGVPAVVVNGKYLVQLREYETFFDVIDFLLATQPVAAKATAEKTAPTEAQDTAETAKTTTATTDSEEVPKPSAETSESENDSDSASEADTETAVEIEAPTETTAEEATTETEVVTEIAPTENAVEAEKTAEQAKTN